MVIHFGTSLQCVPVRIVANGEDHALLHSQLVASMAAAIDDVENRGEQDHLAARKFGNVAILLASGMEVLNVYYKAIGMALSTM
jgi:hypothetical protein